MKKIVLNFDDVKDDILSPGRIVWLQKSGTEILLSAKGSFLNLEMIKKLISAGHMVMIEEDGEAFAHVEILDAFHKLQKEEHIKHQLKYRNQIVTLLARYYLHMTREQEDLNVLAWKMFSEVSRDDARHFLNRDIVYFKRSMSVASSITVCAFLIGYYDTKFLKKLFSSTLRNLMTLGKEKSIYALKEKLEVIRKKPHLNEDDLAFIRTIVDPENFSQKLLLEKFDGSGVMSFSTQDMYELEILLCSLNYYYSWDEFEGRNVLYEIMNGEFKTNMTVVALIKRSFECVSVKTAVA